MRQQLVLAADGPPNIYDGRLERDILARPSARKLPPSRP